MTASDSTPGGPPAQRPHTGTALVTGSSRGIGAETVRLLAAAGASVAINYRDKAARADALVNELSGDGTNAIAVRADLTDSAAVADVMARVRKRFGQLDLLVLNASGDMIEGTITAKLLERANPGALDERRNESGRLYTVEEFAAELVRAAVAPVPDDHTVLIGDTSAFSLD